MKRMNDYDLAEAVSRVAQLVLYAARISRLHNCSDCGHKGYDEHKHKKCMYLPDWGDDVRINCPHWVQEDEEG